VLQGREVVLEKDRRAPSAESFVLVRGNTSKMTLMDLAVSLALYLIRVRVD
jgi:hypothetical protein